MKKYRVGVHYQEGTVLRIYADSPEQAKEKAQEILDDSVQAVYPKECKPKIVHRETLVQDTDISEENN
tara:strand:+ start:217 stop:420 length:204 start_codon:yes stop_codon:yes gene_type:complete